MDWGPPIALGLAGSRQCVKGTLSSWACCAAGWGDKPGVRIVFGRWQEVLPQLGQYDGIFFDTFGEYYDDLR